MALILGDNFSYQGAKPLDGRLEYKTLADMKAVADATMYDGCIAYCVASDKTYQWKAANTVDADTGKWREFSSGGSGGTTDYSNLDNKPSINNVTLSGNKSFDDLGINLINDLANYYLKTEVDDIVTAIKNSRFEVVQTLPTENIKTNVIYLVPKSTAGTSNVKDEYINLNGTSSGWEKIGDTEVDLTDYVTNSDLTTALADYVTNTALTTALNDYVASADLTTILANYALANNVHNIPAGGTAGQILQKKTNNDYDAEWVDNSGGDSVVNGYMVENIQTFSTVMECINWINAHDSANISVPDTSIFNNKAFSEMYMFVGPTKAYLLFSDYPFTIDAYYLKQNSTYYYNSSRKMTDGSPHPAYNTTPFLLTNGITALNSITVSGSGEIDVDSSLIPDNDAVGRIYKTANVTFDNTSVYKDKIYDIGYQQTLYSDAQHETAITPTTGVIYVDVPTGNTYEWNGTAYVQIGGSSGDVSDISNATATFSEASTRANIASGETSATLFGKIKKFFTDLKTVAFTGSYNDLSNKPTIPAAYTLPTASSSTLGGVKIGDNMQIDSSGKISPSYLVVANKFNKSDLYSTTEKVVGCWTDGKPIYQKTFTGTIPTVASGSVSVAIGATIDKIINLSGMFLENNRFKNIDCFITTTTSVTQTTSPTIANHTHPTQRLCAQVYNNSATSSQGPNTILIQNNVSSWESAPYYITIQYTKTTDSANSFNYASENDYSTNEKIVGTWIDGSLLYQKTITGTTSSSALEVTLMTGSAINLISAKGYCCWGTSRQKSNLPWGDNDNYLNVYQDANNILFNYSVDFKGKSYSITLQYTK